MNRLENVRVLMLMVAAVAGNTLFAQTPPKTVALDQTYLLSGSADGSAIKTNVVERSAVNRERFVDIAGVRLWVDNAESLARIRARIAEPSAARR